MATRNSSGLRSTIAIVLMMSGTGTALAAPSIQAVYTDLSKGGVPVSINIVGSGFTCPDCGPPTVALGGLSLTLKAHSAKVITAALPQPLASGDYTLAVTTGPAPRAEVARFSLSVGPIHTGRVVTTAVARSTVRTEAMPPPPDLLRGASMATTRSAGPLSRSGRSSAMTSVVAAASTASTVGTLPEPTLDQVVSDLPEYNTAYGEYALFDLSRGYNSGTRGNSAFGYGALLKTTSGSFNNGFGFYALYNNVEGGYNSAFGNWAMYSNTSGVNNSAFGHEALYSNITGVSNTASGVQALYGNITGFDNTASGYGALYSNTTGGANSASGAYALYSNTTGGANSASGAYALYSNTTGVYNTTSGYYGLHSNTTGSWNTASGFSTMYSNTTGSSNTANGATALFSNNGGSENTASGAEALRNNMGNHNTASGFGALYFNMTGNGNTALGYLAGEVITTGHNNIHIGSNNSGLPSDSGVIRLGRTGYQNRTFIAGIRAVTTGQNNAMAVLIDSDGQLGTVSSSRRYKEYIQPMGSMSDRLFALRPVTFRYRKPYEDGSQPVQFGLIAEEVAAVLPELVINDASGQPETVAYHVLPTLLLNELQRAHATIETHAGQIAAMQRRLDEVDALRAEVAALRQLALRTQPAR